MAIEGLAEIPSFEGMTVSRGIRFWYIKSPPSRPHAVGDDIMLEGCISARLRAFAGQIKKLRVWRAQAESVDGRAGGSAPACCTGAGSSLSLTSSYHRSWCSLAQLLSQYPVCMTSKVASSAAVPM